MSRRVSSPSREAKETLRALRRAARNALELGIRTGTPVYVMRNNKIVDLTKEQGSSRKSKSKRSQRKSEAYETQTLPTVTRYFPAARNRFRQRTPSNTGYYCVQKSEMRCGWFSNPTPGNASLYDRDGEWIIGVQGGYQADGDWPAFSGEPMDRNERALWLWLRVYSGASGSRSGESNEN